MIHDNRRIENKIRVETIEYINTKSTKIHFNVASSNTSTYDMEEQRIIQ